MATKQKPKSEFINGRHFAFAHPRKGSPSRPRVRPLFQPFKIDARKFIIDRIRPYPEWPLICIVANLPAFTDDKELNAYIEKFTPGCVVLIKWDCIHCRKKHFWSVGGYLFDTNGSHAAGAKNIPDRIKELANE